MPGRIQSYTHSDNSTLNKGGALVKVVTQSDFAARTPQFQAFCKRFAMLAYGHQQTDPARLLEDVPELRVELEELKALLREDIRVTDIVLLSL